MHVIKRHLLNMTPQYVHNLKATTQVVSESLRRASAKGVCALLCRLDHFSVVPSAAAVSAGAGAGSGVGPVASGRTL